jgi:DNA-binding MarR family transcriptional regulator
MRFKDTIGISYDFRKIELILRKKIDQALIPLHLTMPKYSVLAILEEQSKLTNAELARKSSVSPQTMVKILHSMESEGLVNKKDDKTNDLKLHYSLTAKAKKIICLAHSEVHKIELDLISNLSKDEYASFQKIFKKLKY